MALSSRPNRSPLVQGLRDHLAGLLAAWLIARWLVGSCRQHRKLHHGGGRRRPHSSVGRD